MNFHIITSFWTIFLNEHDLLELGKKSITDLLSLMLGEVKGTHHALTVPKGIVLGREMYAL